MVGRLGDVAEASRRLGRLPGKSDDVPASWVSWVANQRHTRALTQLSARRSGGLAGWSWRPSQDHWENRARKLRQFL